MNQETPILRRGWTTGACATAATKAALTALWGGACPEEVSITLPRGETPDFAIVDARQGVDWAEASVIKDAGDDPDVTHGARITVQVRHAGKGVTFQAGIGVGTVTLPGLPLAVGAAAINPKPREMMTEVVTELAAHFHTNPDVEITVSVENGAELATKTWNPRLGILGGLSILGTTGVVRPFSCAAWIASIHRGVDVARAAGITHVAGCTGATSEEIVQAHYDLPDLAMLDMGDFVGGLVKYLRKHPVDRLTIGGGIGKLTKLAQGAVDLHSGRSQVDFAALAQMLGDPDVAEMNTALEVYSRHGADFAAEIANLAQKSVQDLLRDDGTKIDVIVIDRAGQIIATAPAVTV